MSTPCSEMGLLMCFGRVSELCAMVSRVESPSSRDHQLVLALPLSSRLVLPGSVDALCLKRLGRKEQHRGSVQMATTDAQLQ